MYSNFWKSITILNKNKILFVSDCLKDTNSEFKDLIGCHDFLLQCKRNHKELDIYITKQSSLSNLIDIITTETPTENKNGSNCHELIKCKGKLISEAICSEHGREENLEKIFKFLVDFGRVHSVSSGYFYTLMTTVVTNNPKEFSEFVNSKGEDRIISLLVQHLYNESIRKLLIFVSVYTSDLIPNKKLFNEVNLVSIMTNKLIKSAEECDWETSRAVLEFLKDLTSPSSLFDTQNKIFFNQLKEENSVKVISSIAFRKLKNNISDIISTNSLDLIVHILNSQFFEENSSNNSLSKKAPETIDEEFLLDTQDLFEECPGKKMSKTPLVNEIMSYLEEIKNLLDFGNDPHSPTGKNNFFEQKILRIIEIIHSMAKIQCDSIILKMEEEKVFSKCFALLIKFPWNTKLNSQLLTLLETLCECKCLKFKRSFFKKERFLCFLKNAVEEQKYNAGFYPFLYFMIVAISKKVEKEVFFKMLTAKDENWVYLMNFKKEGDEKFNKILLKKEYDGLIQI